MSAGCQNYTQLHQIYKPVMRPEYRTVGIYGLIKVISSEEKQTESTAVEGQRGGSAGVN